MKNYVINLDRRPLRWQRMAGLLQGLDVKRVTAVDGQNIDGPEYRDRSRPLCYEALSRYERACILSHRAAWQEFLAGGDRYGCIFEDDVLISPDFPRFIENETWIPDDCNVMKIETCRQEIFLSRKIIACLDRSAARPRSLHFGSAAYIVSRQGALALLDATLRPDRSIDCIMFEERGLKKMHPVYQLFPALCIQGCHQPGTVPFAEMESSVQPNIQPRASPQPIVAQKTLSNKIKRELTRPFRQLKNSVQSTGTLALHRLRGVRRCSVPFA